MDRLGKVRPLLAGPSPSVLSWGRRTILCHGFGASVYCLRDWVPFRFKSRKRIVCFRVQVVMEVQPIGLSTNRVTGLVCEKITKEVAQPIFC
jgi:hypothetical protein